MTDSREDSYDRANIPIAVQGVAAVAVFRYSPQPQPSTVAFSKARFRIAASGPRCPWRDSNPQPFP